MNSYKKLILKNTLLVCVLFSAFFTISFYAERYISTKNGYQKTTQLYLDSVSENMNAAFDKMQDLLILLPAGEPVQEYVENPNPYTRRLLKTHLLSSIASVPSTKCSIGIAVPGDQNIVTNISGTSLDYFLNSLGLPYDEINNIIQSPIDEVGSVPYVYFSSANGHDYMTLLMYNNTHFANSYVIFSVYNMSTLIESSSDASLLVSHNDNILYSNSGLPEGKLSKLAMGKRVFGYNTVARISKTSTMLGDVTYTAIIPTIQYFSYINKHTVFVILSFIILFILSLFLAQYISDRSYTPIKRLMEQIDDIDSETLENEIDAISSAISLLSKRNQALSNIVESNRCALRDKFINDLIRGHLTEEQINYGIDTYLSKSASALPLALIIIDAEQSISETGISENEDLLSFNLVVKTLFEREFSEESFFYFTSFAPSTYCVLVSSKNIEDLKQRLKRLLLNSESDLGIDMYSSIGRQINSWQELPNVYLSTYFTHTNMKSRAAGRTVSTSEEINVPIFYSGELENELFTLCIRHEKEKLKKSLDFLVSENFPTEKEFAERLPQLSVLIYALCMRILTFTGIDINSVLGSDYNIYLELKMCQSVQDFQNRLNFIFNNISDNIEHSQTVDENQYCDSMLNYIHNNYQNDISLQTLAEYMNMSQAYVSRLFKRLANCNFKDYLAKIRIEQAIKLLTDYPDKNITEISSMSGFNTVKTFTSIFIKYVGMTPSEYRRLHKTT